MTLPPVKWLFRNGSYEPPPGDDALFKLVFFEDQFAAGTDNEITRAIPAEFVAAKYDVLHHFRAIFEIHAVSRSRSAVFFEAIVLDQPRCPPQYAIPSRRLRVSRLS